MTEINENNCNIESTKQVISDLYKNVTMAQSSIKTLIPYVEQKDVAKRLGKQVEEYHHFVEQVGAVGDNLGFHPTPAPKFAITMANMGIKAKMLGDDSQTHVAKIMMQGTLNGIIDLYRLQRQHPDVHPEVSVLLKQILHYEESCLESCKNLL